MSAPVPPFHAVLPLSLCELSIRIAQASMVFSTVFPPLAPPPRFVKRSYFFGFLFFGDRNRRNCRSFLGIGHVYPAMSTFTVSTVFFIYLLIFYLSCFLSIFNLFLFFFVACFFLLCCEGCF